MSDLKVLKSRQAELVKSGKAARTFLDGLLDSASFVEMDTFVYSDTVAGPAVGEGVVSGFGSVNGNDVYVYVQNSEVLKGALGQAHADKIVKCMSNADKAGVPIISVIDSQGARLDEGIGALEGYAQVLGVASRLKVPHICIVKGASYGMITVLTQLADFVLLTDKSVTLESSPLIVAQGSGKTAEKLGGAKVIVDELGLADYYGSESAVTDHTKKIINYIYNVTAVEDDANRLSAALNNTTDLNKVIEEVFDKGSFVESLYGAAKGVRTGLAQLDGVTVGVAAVGTNEGGELTGADLKKLSRWVGICDFLDIPFVNLVDTSGVKYTSDASGRKVVADMASVIAAYSNYDGVLVSVIVNRAVGFGYSAFASKGVGYDYVLAWADARVSALTDEAMARLVYADEIKKDGNSEKVLKKLAEQYNASESDVYYAALKGFVDNIVEPSHTRQYLIAVLGMRL